MFLQLPRDQILLRDAQFFFFRVAGYFDDLHAVAQRGQDGVDQIGSGDEHDFREIERDPQIMIGEGKVLLWVEHFEQRRRRVSAEVHSHLVDFIEHKNRVVGAALLDALNDPARQCADIGASMAADFRFIPHPAEADPDKLTSKRPGNRFPE